MKKRGLAAEETGWTSTLRPPDGIERVIRSFKVVAYRIPNGCCAAYYPEANPLLPLYAHDAISGTPSVKAIPVVLTRPSGAGEEWSSAAGMPR